MIGAIVLLLKVAAGYLVAVAVATLLTAGLMLAAINSGNSSIYYQPIENASLLMTYFAVSGWHTFVYGLPGFALVAAVAWRWQWRARIRYMLAGMANAILAILLLDGTGYLLGDPVSVASSLAGGMGGGIAYGQFAKRYLVQQ